MATLIAPTTPVPLGTISGRETGLRSAHRAWAHPQHIDATAANLDVLCDFAPLSRNPKRH